MTLGYATWLIIPALIAAAFSSPSSPPLSTVDPANLGFGQVTRKGEHAPQLSTYCFTDKRTAYDTNHWWVAATRPTSSIGKNLLSQLPYIYVINPSSMDIYYPYVTAMGNLVQNMLPQAGASWSISPQSSADNYCVEAADSLTVSFKWGSAMRSTIVRGSPYVTVKSEGGALSLKSPHAISKFMVDGKEAKCAGDKVTGSIFSVVLKSSDSEWFVWAPPNTKIACGPDGLTTGKFSGYLRLALASNCTTGKMAVGLETHCGGGNPQGGSLQYKEALKESSNVCIDGGSVNSEKSLEGIKTTFSWHAFSCWGSETDPLAPLMMTAMPHHMKLLPQDGSVKVVEGGGHRNVRGYSRGVQTTAPTWTLETPGGEFEWLGTPDRDKKEAILKALKGADEASDVNFDVGPWTGQGMTDPYNGGKLIAKIAYLALISDQMGEDASTRSLVKKLRTYLSMWFDGVTKNRLVYDDSWGGIISCGCTYIWNDETKIARCANDGQALECPTLKDIGYDFGNSVYNDHHFHYGYHIYSSAVLASFDKKWMKKYDAKVKLLIRDIANPSDKDPHFPQYRMFDWFEGHSWALGIVADANGKNQESCSEAINAWYGIYLYGEVSGEEQLKTLGHSLALMEATSANSYWRVHHHEGIYPAEYEHDVVGIMHDMLVEFQTFFGLRKFFVYGIQIIPVTPMVHQMLALDWTKKALPEFKESCEADKECTESGFVTFMYTSQALVDKSAAWKNVQNLPNSVFSLECPGGNGNSRTGIYHFVASSGNKATTRYVPKGDFSEAEPQAPVPKALSISRGTMAATGLAIVGVIFVVANWRARGRGGTADERLGLLAECDYIDVDTGIN